MDQGPAFITHDEGVDDGFVNALRQAVSDMRTFLAKAEEFDLALSDYNYVTVIGVGFKGSEAEIAGLEHGTASGHGAGLAEFDRDLVSLHLPLEGQPDEGHLYEAVWRTTASIERFRRLLDLPWYFNCEYSLGDHRALDQRH